MDILRTAPQTHTQFSQNTSIEDRSIQLSFNDPIVREGIVDEYPYSEQTILKGNLAYEGEVYIEGLPPNTESYDVRYRTQSGLLQILGVDDYSQVQSVLTDTNSAVEGPPLMQVPFQRLGLWSFIFSGDHQGRIEVIDAQNNRYANFGEIEDLPRSRLAREYNPSAATISFSNHPTISDTYVKYSDGKLSFESDVSEHSREFVLQLYEKHVVEGHILPDLRRDQPSGDSNSSTGETE